MTTILCFGDSITWGFNPADGTRFPFERRWSGVLEATLGPGARVIEEGLNGRTVATDSWVLPNRDGRAMLAPLLETHAPLDWVILMLGTNDVAPTYKLEAAEIAFGMATLVWTVQKSGAGTGGGAPQILVVAPPPLGRMSPLMELFFAGAEAKSRALAAAYATVAEANGCRFLDASTVAAAGDPDGVHPDAAGQRALGLAVSQLLAETRAA